MSGLELCCPRSCISAEASVGQQVGTGCAQAAHVSASLHHFVLWEPGWSSPVWNGFRFVCSELGSFCSEYREDEFSERRDDSGHGNPSRLCL